MLAIFSILVSIWRGFALALGLYLAQARMSQPLGLIDMQRSLVATIVLVCLACWIIPIVRSSWKPSWIIRISAFAPMLTLIGATIWYRLTIAQFWNTIYIIVIIGMIYELFRWIFQERVADFLDLCSLPNDEWRMYFKHHRQMWMNTRELAYHQSCTIADLINGWRSGNPVGNLDEFSRSIRDRRLQYLS